VIRISITPNMKTIMAGRICDERPESGSCLEDLLPNPDIVRRNAGVPALRKVLNTQLYLLITGMSAKGVMYHEENNKHQKSSA